MEIIAPPSTAGNPPPGWTDDPTRHSHDRRTLRWAGEWNGPDRRGQQLHRLGIAANPIPHREHGLRTALDVLAGL